MENETKFEKIYEKIMTPFAYVVAYSLSIVLYMFFFIVKLIFLPFTIGSYLYFGMSDEYFLNDKFEDRYVKIKKAIFIVLIISLLVFLIALIIYPPIQSHTGDWLYTLCEDGWKSQSRWSGTCSWHGGIDHYVYEELPKTYHFFEYSIYYLFVYLSSSTILILHYLPRRKCDYIESYWKLHFKILYRHIFVSGIFMNE